MTPEDVTVFEIKQIIARMPEADRVRTEVYTELFRRLISDDEAAQMALALIGAEIAAQP